MLSGRTQEKLDEAARELALPDDRILVFRSDVSEEQDVKALFEATVEKFGRVDVVFNNAGTEGVIAPTADYPVEAFDQVIRINLRGTFLCMRYALNYLGEGGVIVNNSSIGGVKAMPNTCAYNSTKFAINGLTRTAAIEYAGKGIRVNSVCPSPVETRMMRSIEAGTGADVAAIKEAFSSSIPMGRYATPEEIANAVVFLSCDESSFVTGINLSVDGGMWA